MTRKDYIEIALAINDTLQQLGVLEKSAEGIEWLIRNLIERLEKDNPRFDPSTFRTACIKNTGWYANLDGTHLRRK